MEEQPTYVKAYVVVRAKTLEEMAEKLTNLSDECWSITVHKIAASRGGIEYEVEALVKTVKETE